MPLKNWLPKSLLVLVLLWAGCAPPNSKSGISLASSQSGLQRGIASSRSDNENERESPEASQERSSKSQRRKKSRSKAASQAEAGLHLLLGNPTDAVSNPDERENYLIMRPQYALSYNDANGHPNWVSWHLSASDIGSVERGQFRPDDSLPQGYTRLTPRDYTGSGYDRGHCCPAADRSAKVEDNDATFLMTNIFPQAPGNNQGPWKDLEEYCRQLAKQGNELYILAGVAGGEKKRIGKGKAGVPDYTWKVVVALPEEEGDDLRRIEERTRVIAIWMPNIDSVRGKDWKSFRVSVREIEKEIGHNLLSALPKKLQDRLETRTDNE